MRLLFFLVVLLILGIPALVVWGAFVAIEDEPLVTGTWQPTAKDIARAKSVLKAHGPRGLPEGQTRSVVISERDMNLAANHALNLLAPGSVRAQMRADVVALTGTAKLPKNPLGQYVNVAARWRASPGNDEAGTALPSLVELRLGGILIPGPIANLLFVQGLGHLYAMQGPVGADPINPKDVISAVAISPGSVRVTYQLPRGALARLRTVLVDADDQSRLEAYHRALVAELVKTGRSRTSLEKVLRPLFGLAATRSKQSNAVLENRALLAVLGAYAGGRGLAAVVPASKHWPKMPKASLSLQGRGDFVQHFLTSAALAAVGGGALSDAIGLFKEVDDSEGGSGFSFTDLAADRAGTRFGALAVRSVGDALRLQTLVGAMNSEAQFMPEARDLPEGLSAHEFKRRYRNTASSAYRQVTDQIERRLDKLALYRDTG